MLLNPSTNFIPRFRLRLALVLMALLLSPFVTSSAQAQIRTVLVSPVPGNPVASGAALQAALAGITAPSATNPWLLKIEPGIYDVGTTSLVMRPWVDIEGSGIDITILKGSVDGSGLNGATVHGADHAELRELTVEANSSERVTAVIALYNPGTSPRVYRVKLVALGTASAWGMRNAASAPLIEECDIRAATTGGSSTFAYGIVYSASAGLPAGRSSIRRSQIKADGTGNNYGIYMTEAQIVNEIRDSRIDALGGSVAIGLLSTYDGSWQTNETLTLRDSEVNAAGASSAAYGVQFEAFTTIYLVVYDSVIWGHVAPQAYAIWHQGLPAVNVQGSSLVGATQVANVAGNLSIASSLMSGGATTAGGWLGCIGVWDEAAVFYTGTTCPP